MERFRVAPRGRLVPVPSPAFVEPGRLLPGRLGEVALVADAPPHMDYQGDVTYGRSALAALHKGIRIHTVAASGLDDHGSLVFRQTAQLSQGKFIFIEYGSSAASAADHGVRGQVASNNLDDILYREIEAEVTGWGEGGGVAHRSRL